MPYYGPAGIFSTDNPQSDQMQIEAEQYYEEQDMELSGVICGGCGKDEYLCTCPPEEEPEKWYNVVATCPKNSSWYEFDLNVIKGDIKVVTEKFVQSHREKCWCHGVPDVWVQ